MTTTDATARPLRADAERNRQRILVAAAEVFAERGLEVSLDDIAAAAGVGVGTVYRRFPDKEVLIDALFEKQISQVEDVARAALAVEDPWASFEQFVRAVCRQQAENRGLKEALLGRDRGRDRVGGARDRIAPLAMQIVARAKAAGVLREDLDGYDVPMMHAAVSFIAEKSRDIAPCYWERLLTIFLDGARVHPDGHTPMPAAPLDREAFQTAMSRRRC